MNLLQIFFFRANKALIVNLDKVVTLVFVIASIALKIFGSREQKWSFEDVWGILFIGIVSALAFGLFYIKKEMSRKLYLFIQILYFLIINSVVLLVGLKLSCFSANISLLILEGIFILIYILVYFLVWRIDFNEAKKINQKLSERKKEMEK